MHFYLIIINDNLKTQVCKPTIKKILYKKAAYTFQANTSKMDTNASIALHCSTSQQLKTN